MYNNLSKRVLTIIIGVPLIFLLLFWGNIPILIIVLLLASFGLNELFNMARKKGFEPHTVFGFILTFYFIFLALYDFNDLKYDKNIIIAFVIILFTIIQLYKKDYQTVLNNISITIFGSIYLGYLSSFILKIKVLPNGNYYLISLLLITWINDSAAYLIGTKFGKNKMFPKISPKKTVEGAVGGIIFSVISIFAFKNWLDLNYSQLIFLGLIISLIAQIGDFFESMIKRDSGVKDSGSIVPGHGGVLDCFDSLLFTAPVFYCYIIFLT